MKLLYINSAGLLYVNCWILHSISMHTVSVSICTQTCLRARACAHPHRDTHICTNVYIHMQVCIAVRQHFGYELLSLPCLKAFEEHLQDLQRICWRTVSTFLCCSSCCQTVCTLWALIAALDWGWIAETSGKQSWNQTALDDLCLYKECSLLTLFTQLNITKASLQLDCKSYLRKACIVLNAESADGLGHISAQEAFQGGAVK